MLSKILARFRKAEGIAPVLTLELRDDAVRYASLKPASDAAGAPYILHASGLVKRSDFSDDAAWKEEALRQIKCYTLKRSAPILVLASNDYRVIHTGDQDVVHAQEVRIALHAHSVDRPDDYIVDTISVLDDSVLGVIVKKSTLQTRMNQAAALGVKPVRVDVAETSLAYLAYALSELEEGETHPNRGVLSYCGNDAMLVMESESTVIRTHRVPAEDIERVVREATHIAQESACTMLYIDAGASSQVLVEAFQAKGIAAEPLHPYGLLAEEVAELFDEQQLQRLVGAAGVALADIPSLDWNAHYHVIPLRPAVDEQTHFASLGSQDRFSFDNAAAAVDAAFPRSTLEDANTFERLDELSNATHRVMPTISLDRTEEPLSFPPLSSPPPDSELPEPVFQSSILQEESHDEPSIVVEKEPRKPSLSVVGGVLLAGLIACVLVSNFIWSVQNNNAIAHQKAKELHTATLAAKKKEALATNRTKTTSTATYSAWMATIAGATPEGLWLTRLAHLENTLVFQGMAKDKLAVDAFAANLNASPLLSKFQFETSSVVLDTTYNLWTFRMEGTAK